MPFEFPTSDRVYQGPPDVIPHLLPNMQQLDWRGIESQVSVKYAGMDFARSVSTEPVRHILDVLDGQRLGLHKYTVVDVRYWAMLYPGQCPGLIGYHTDVTPADNAQGKPERHLLVSWGGWPTQFLRRNRTADQIRNSSHSGPVDPWFVPSDRAGGVVVYGRDHLHSARKVDTPGPRLLVRVTETDLVTPKRRIKAPPLFNTEYAATGHNQYGINLRLKRDRNR